jgi:uncharacterized cupin superfamily protein
MNSTSVRNAEHYVWGDGCDGWYLLACEDLSVIEECMPAGTSEQRHWHARARQFFYVLTGEAVLEMNDACHVLRPGDGLHVPPGVPHQIRNESATDVRFLVVSAPKSHGDRVAWQAPLRTT